MAPPPDARVGVIPGSARDARIDALRGFALLGILLVNIQSFVSGAPNAIGFLGPEAGAADRVAYFLTAAFVVGKFMPLYAMLFGAGFALLHEKLRARFAHPDRVYRRRLLFLFAFGLLHGLFIYFGDITLAYSVAGLVLLLHARNDAMQLARATRRWWIVAVAWLLLSILPWSGAEPSAALVEMVERNIEAGRLLGYWEQWPVRAEMAWWQQQANLFGLPTFIALMLTGALSQRAGWLRNLDALVWRRASQLGLAFGLPAGLAYGLWAVTHAQLDESLAMSTPIFLVQAAGLTLAFLYASVFLRRAPAPLIAWLAPAGRMPLSNYLIQSLAMGVLLPGWGLGLEARLGYAALSGVAVTVFISQVLTSHWWLANFAQGPLEALWRTWTYRGAARSV